MPDDDDTEIRLARIEANMVSKADLAVLRVELHDDLVRELASVATNVNDLRSELRTNIDALRVETQGLTGMLRPLAEALARWPDLFANLADRVRRLEERRPPNPA